MKWGLALSGGALRGAAHIGILSVLEENNLYPHYIAGTSSGSLVAALFALGFSAQQMTELLGDLSARELYDLNIGWSTIWSLLLNGLMWLMKAPPEKYRSLPDGLLKGQKLARWIEEITEQKSFYSTHIPLAVMTTDINSGEAVCFHTPGRGPKKTRLAKPVSLREDVSLSLALRASTAIPGIFSPVKIHGRTLVDGGVVDNLPSQVLRAMGADRVLAVNLGYAGQQKRGLDNGMKIAAQAIDIMAREITLFRGVQAADLVLNPQIYDVGLTDFDKLLDCVQRGRKAAQEKLPKIMALLS